MNVYVTHSKHFFDYQKELYEPLENSVLAQNHKFIFPHNENETPFSSKKMMQSKGFDLILAEVSYPATGQGIELGWADAYSIPIVCIYKENAKIAGSLKRITNSFVEYNDHKDLVEKLGKILNE